MDSVTMDPDHWKGKYESEWSPGARRVRHVLVVLGDRFPNLTIEPREYATSEEYIPPDEGHEKHEPDIVVSADDTVICEIEVTGSDIQMMPSRDIYILKGKFIAALRRSREKDLDTWFYTVYRHSEYVLDLNLVGKHDSDKAVMKPLKGSPEWYIEIPCAEAYPKETLFEWIESRI